MKKREEQMEELMRDTRMYIRRIKPGSHIDGAGEQSGQGGQGEEEEVGHLILVLYYKLHVSQQATMRLILRSNY